MEESIALHCAQQSAVCWGLAFGGSTLQQQETHAGSKVVTVSRPPGHPSRDRAFFFLCAPSPPSILLLVEKLFPLNFLSKFHLFLRCVNSFSPKLLFFISLCLLFRLLFRPFSATRPRTWKPFVPSTLGQSFVVQFFLRAATDRLAIW